MKNVCFQMNRKAWLAMVMLLCLSFPALAQKITVTGTVTDSEGEPLIGASILAEGTSVGTSADIDGNYRIEVEPNGVLVFSYVGYDTQRIPVDNRTTINVVLKENSVMLDEVVAIGYGVVKKSDATGSVAVIKPDDIEAGIATSTQDLLVGASPGVVVTTDGGNPTGGATIRIRGGSSLNASNDPLIVIDGVPQTNQTQGGGMNALTMINPSDIESMTILKDASATAIYGSRASNGVIIVTTKKGTSGRPQVTFSANLSVNTARKKLNMMNGVEFAEVVTNNMSESSIAQLGYDGKMYNTDWQKEVLRTSFSQDYNLSVGGQAGWLPYRVNVGYTDNEGILKTSSMERVTAGITLSPKFFNGKLSIIAKVLGTYGRTGNADTGAIGGAVANDPTKPLYTNIAMGGGTGRYLYNGYYNYTPGGVFDRNGTINPLQLLNDVDSHNDTWSSTGNLNIDYALHFLPDLHVHLDLGYQVSENKCKSITAANSVQAWNNSTLTTMGAGGAEQLYKWYELQRNTMLEFYLNYRKEVESIKSNFDVVAGYSWQRFSYFGNSANFVNSLGFLGENGAESFTNYGDGTYFMTQNPANHIGEQIGDRNRWAAPTQLLSFYGRVNYQFDNTYLLTVTLRDDASSRFSKDTRWGLFPAVALGWKISNMGSLKESDILDEWKLRLGWGETGQQEIGSYFPYLPVYVISSNGNFMYPGYYNGKWINPIYPTAYDANIKWETTETWNVGMDFAFLNNRITAGLDWYLRDTRDLLASTPAIGLQTSDYVLTNIGTLRNTGLEFNVVARPVVTKNFTWTSSANIGWNRNKITKLNEGVPMPARGVPGGGIGGDLQWYIEGEPAYTYRVYQQVYDADGNPIAGQYVDQNADGEINDQDLIKYHSPEPKVTISWSNSFNYKNWDFGIALRANLGNYVYNAPRRTRTNIATVDAYGLHNLMRDEFLFNNPENKAFVLSDYWVENASFLRCDNITAGYTWQKLFNQDLRLRLFGAVQNPFVITKYKGIDPEVFDGRDDNVYPRPVTFTLGLVATF